MADTFLAVFVGSKTSSRMQAWQALTDAERDVRVKAGMAAWHAWMDRHQDSLLFPGGPLGKTKKISASGIEDISNPLGAFCVIKAESHEAAAAMFENHPHFSIFPGEGVEVMPVMPIPGG